MHPTQLPPEIQEQVLARHGALHRFRDLDPARCALVIIDFLVRHGYLDPEDRDYLAIVAGLRQREVLLEQFPK